MWRIASYLFRAASSLLVELFSCLCTTSMIRIGTCTWTYYKSLVRSSNLNLCSAAVAHHECMRARSYSRLAKIEYYTGEQHAQATLALSCIIIYEVGVTSSKHD